MTSAANPHYQKPKSTWFMMHRIREAMREGKFPPLGGEGKFVEADETFTGGKAKNRAYKEPPPKEAVMALVERGGKVHSYHVPEVTAATLKRGGTSRSSSAASMASITTSRKPT